MGEKVCTSRCAGCFFQGRSTGTCDYIFIVGVRRPCPPGKACTAYVAMDRKEEFMRKPNWDTEAGRQMWMSGKKDGEIADVFGISTGAVTSYRLKYWQQTITPKRGKIKEQKAPVEAGAGVNPAVLDKIRDNAEKVGNEATAAGGGRKEPSEWPRSANDEGTPLPWKMSGTATGIIPQSPQAAPESPLAGMKAFDFERGLKPPAGEPDGNGPGPETETIPQSPPEAVPAPFTQGSHDGVAEDLTAEKTVPAEVPALEEQEQPKVPSRDALDAIADALKTLQELKNGKGAASAREIATPPVAATPHQSPAAPASPQGEAFRVPRPRLDEMDIMAAATEHLSGMQAVCTACAIQALWFWTGPADLRRAKKSIDWLLDHMEG